MRWMADGDGRWELNAEMPATIEGTARPVLGDPLPLGLSRGPHITRPKQLDFLHRFMASPLVPSSASRDGLSVHLPHLAHNWSVTIMEQIHVQKFVSVVEEKLNWQEGASWSNDVKKHLHDVMSLGVGTDFFYHTRHHFAAGAVWYQEW